MPQTTDRRIFSTEWAWEPNRLCRVKRFFAVYEDCGKYEVVSVAAFQGVSLDEIPSVPSQLVQKTHFESRMEGEEKAFDRLVKWCDFLAKGAI